MGGSTAPRGASDPPRLVSMVDSTVMAMGIAIRGRRPDAPDDGARPQRRARRPRGRRGLVRARRPRGRRGLVRAAMVLTGAVTVVVGAGLVLLASTPSARGAPPRVRAILAAHSAPSLDGRLPARVATALLATTV